MSFHPKHIAEHILKQYPEPFTPKLGIVLGSGLGPFADTLEHAVSIPYHNIPGFPAITVKGHAGELVLGYCQGIPIVCLKGRAHLYEGISSAYIKTYIRTLKCLGCEYFIATNAAGSLNLDMPPGELMLIRDHINFSPINPLVGHNDEEFGPRFLALDNAYDTNTSDLLLSAAQECQIKLHQGVYFAVLGPCYETAAEIKAFKILGADAVGMSTVPEVIVANHASMKVAAISIITNYATGLNKQVHNHNEIVYVANQAIEKLIEILHHFLKKIK